jgi:hypothetical protein
MEAVYGPSLMPGGAPRAPLLGRGEDGVSAAEEADDWPQATEELVARAAAEEARASAAAEAEAEGAARRKGPRGQDATGLPLIRRLPHPGSAASPQSSLSPPGPPSFPQPQTAPRACWRARWASRRRRLPTRTPGQRGAPA